MEYAKNGSSWRVEATKQLNKLGIGTWNPYVEEKKLFDFDIQTFIKLHDKKKDYNKFNEVMRKIVTTDLGVIAKDVDMVLVKYDKSVLRGAGTHAEISMATYLNKPVHVWVEDLEIENIPLWSIGCFTTLSTSLEEAIEKVKSHHEITNRISA
jgi:hypothetical protein